MLYAEGFAFLFIAHVFFCTLSGAPYGWDHKLERPAFLMIATQSVMGLALSRVLLYADAGAVSKTMTSGVRELISIVTSPLLFATRFYVICKLCAFMWVACSICIYFLPWITVRTQELAHTMEELSMLAEDEGDQE